MKIITCKHCEQERKYHAKGMCKRCYQNYRNSLREKEIIREQRKWTTEELEYICIYCEVDEIEDLSLALDRTKQSINGKLSHLRKKGTFDYYKKSYERKLSD